MGANNYAKKAKKAFLYLVRALSVKRNASSKVMINISKISVKLQSPHSCYNYRWLGLKDNDLCDQLLIP